MAKGSATEVSSVGPITATYAFRSWVLVEKTGESARRRVGSGDELAALIRELGVPEWEAATVAGRLWDARPDDATLPNVRPWEGWVPSTGLSRLQLFALVAGLAALAGLILWLTA
jgi:hypothetical protein